MTEARVIVAISAAVIATAALPARAQGISRQQCLDAFEAAQRKQKNGQLRDARAGFRVCADSSCPALVRRDCTDRLAALATLIPSLRVTVRDARGEELDDYTLEIDGRSVEPGAGAIELDPGEHVVRVLTPDGNGTERRVTLAPRDQSLPLVLTVSDDASAPATPAAAGDRGPVSRPVPVVVYVLGGAAVVGLAGFVGFGLAGRSTQRCEGSCSDDEIDRLHRQYLLADVGLALFAVAGGAAAYFYLSRPTAAGERGPAAFMRARPLGRGAALWAGVRY